MLILGVDTATSQVGCAIGGHEGVIASAHVAGGRRHAETLAPAIDFIRRQADIGLEEIGAVAVDVGPGLFTGLRVGIATAKAVAHALSVPMIGIPSLDLLAFPLRFTSRVVVAVIDARRGEVFHALYRSVPGGIQRVSDLSVGSPEDLVAELLVLDGDVLLVGDGALRYHETFEQVGNVELAEQGLAHPSAGSLVQLAHARALREEFVPHWEIDPIYLRRPDAQINWEVRTRPRPGTEVGS